jgi:uncharacterized membrane protein
LRIKQLELYVSYVLRLGVLLSGAFLLLGLGLLVWTGDASCPLGDISIVWLIYGDPFWSPSHILFLGFMVLVATPLLRVISSTVVYGFDHDWVFMGITGMVFLVLLVGIILGVG